VIQAFRLEGRIHLLNRQIKASKQSVGEILFSFFLLNKKISSICARYFYPYILLLQIYNIHIHRSNAFTPTGVHIYPDETARSFSRNARASLLHRTQFELHQLGAPLRLYEYYFTQRF
jgi:hypothetical protein